MGKCLNICLFSISLVILLIGILIGALLSTEEVFYKKATKEEINYDTEMSYYINSTQTNELPMKVLNSKGALDQVGWTTDESLFSDQFTDINPSTTQNLPFISSFLNKNRLKKWEAYSFVSKDYVGGIFTFDFNYLGGVVFHISKINHGKQATTDSDSDESNKTSETSSFPLFFEYLNPLFHPQITELDYSKDVIVNNGITSELYSQFFNTSTSEVKSLLFQRTVKKNHHIKFAFQRKDFSIDVDVSLRGQDKDSMVTLNPISEDKTLFYYCVKGYNLVPSGVITINKERIDLKGASFIYDHGRGVWPLKSGWVWIGAGGLTTEGEEFEFNAGHGFTHSIAQFTEDAFFVNGKLHKLYNIQYQKSEEKNEHGHYNWHFSNEGSSRKNDTDNKNQNFCELEFIVTSLKDSVTRVLIADLVFNIHYGYYKGTCMDDSGKKYQISHVTGLIEEKMSLW